MMQFKEQREQEDYLDRMFYDYDNQYIIVWKTALKGHNVLGPVSKEEADKIFFTLCETHGVFDIIKAKVDRGNLC